METLKNKIKELASNQKFLKNQRKTVNLIGERKINPEEAAYKHWSNRCDLRILNVAYALLKGKELSEIEINPKTPIDMKEVEEIKKQYIKEFVNG